MLEKKILSDRCLFSHLVDEKWEKRVELQFLKFKFYYSLGFFHGAFPNTPRLKLKKNLLEIPREISKLTFNLNN